MPRAGLLDQPPALYKAARVEVNLLYRAGAFWALVGIISSPADGSGCALVPAYLQLQQLLIVALALTFLPWVARLLLQNVGGLCGNPLPLPATIAVTARLVAWGLLNFPPYPRPHAPQALASALPAWYRAGAPPVAFLPPSLRLFLSQHLCLLRSALPDAAARGGLAAGSPYASLAEALIDAIGRKVGAVIAMAGHRGDGAEEEGAATAGGACSSTCTSSGRPASASSE